VPIKVPAQQFTPKTKKLIVITICTLSVFLMGIMIGMEWQNNIVNKKMLKLQCTDYLNVVG